MSASETSRPASTRYHHLDALRGAMMMWGVLVHTSTLGRSAFFDGATWLSGLVRMSAFFIVSGFLGYMLAERYGSKATVLKRIFSVGVPFVTCLILLNPVTNFLIYCYHNEPMPFLEYLRTGGAPDARGPMVWSLHLWFLIVLLVFGFATPMLKSGVDWLLRRGEAMMERAGDGLLFCSMCVALSVGCLATRGFYELLLESVTPKPLMFIVRSTFYYLPFFAFGMLLFKSQRLLQVFSRLHVFHLVFSLGLMHLARISFEHQPRLVAEILQALARAYVGVALSSALFFLFGKLVPRKNAAALYLSEAAYSVYLFHFLTIYVLATALRPALGGGEGLLWVVALLTLAITLLIHHFLILKFPVLRAAFNGKFPGLVKRKVEALPGHNSTVIASER